MSAGSLAVAFAVIAAAILAATMVVLTPTALGLFVKWIVGGN